MQTTAARMAQTAKIGNRTFLEFLFSQKNVLFIGDRARRTRNTRIRHRQSAAYGRTGVTEIRHLPAEGIFSHEEELARNLSIDQNAESGIRAHPISSRPKSTWDQLVDVLEENASKAAAGAPLNLQIFKEMEDLLKDG